MSLLLLTDNEPIPFPSELVDVVRFLVYIKTEENFSIQLNQKCMLSSHCVGETNDPQVEL